MMTWDYAAGFMDADGTFGFVKEYGSPRLRMSAGQASRPVLEQLQELCFGYGSIAERRPGYKGTFDTNKPFYVWQTGGFKIVSILVILEPKLIVKQDKVREMLDFAYEKGYAADIWPPHERGR